jgi:mxaJ protein
MMRSVSRRLVLLAVCWAAFAAVVQTAPPLRVCADPNNMPFSNDRREGFENKIAALVAGALHRPLAYFWLPQRRGFIRNSLNAGRCDVVMGVPAQYGLLQPTRPYYRSSYVFVSRRDRKLRIESFDAVPLKTLKIGIQVSGDDYNNPPAAQALAARGIVENVRGFTIYGDYSRSDPQRAIVDAVADGRVDVSIVWGPIAGYYGEREPAALDITPIAVDRDGPLQFAFDISMGVRRDDVELRKALDAIVATDGQDIRRILRVYGVPLLMDDRRRPSGDDHRASRRGRG